MTRRPAFTLLEVLLAVMLTGMVTTLALAPVVATVQRVVSIQSSWSDTAALSRALAFIGRDVAGAVRLAQTALLVEDHQTLLGEEDDILAVMSSSPTRQQMPAGSMVYKLDQGSPLSRTVPGLYRWFFPGKQPNEVDTKTLPAGEGQLILPGVTAFSVEVPRKSERAREYRGSLPMGLYVALSRGEETLEDVFVFP